MSLHRIPGLFPFKLRLGTEIGRRLIGDWTEMVPMDRGRRGGGEEVLNAQLQDSNSHYEIGARLCAEHQPQEFGHINGLQK